MDARVLVALAAFATAFVVQPRAAGDVPRDARPAITSADLLLRAGSSKTILHIPKVGWWTAKCGRVVSRTSSAPLARRISPHHRVTPDPPLEVVLQHWQFMPFAEAQVRVTTADVVGRVVGAYCMTSVMAVTGPDQGPTREG